MRLLIMWGSEVGGGGRLTSGTQRHKGHLELSAMTFEAGEF